MFWAVFALIALANCEWEAGNGREMKVIGLLAVRNEVHTIQFCLRALAVHTDAIVILDDRSDDGTQEAIETVAKECNIYLIKKEGRWTSGSRDETLDRQRVLEYGRNLGGTHFIVIDGDEALTGNWAGGELRDTLEAMSPGDIISMHWVYLWKSPLYYRTDRLYDVFGDFQGVGMELGAAMLPIFCDDGVASYVGEFIHTYRVPKVRGRTHHISDPQLGLLHFQFVFWPNVIIKQAWYKCMERIRLPHKSIEEINERYAVTLEQVGIRAARSNPAWFEPFGSAEVLSAFNHLDRWRLDMIRDWLSHSPKQFEGLGIQELLSRNGVSLTTETGRSLEGGGSSSARQLIAQSLTPVPVISFIIFIAQHPASRSINVSPVLLESLKYQSSDKFEIVLCAPGNEDASYASLEQVAAKLWSLGIENVKTCVRPPPDVVFEPRYEDEGIGPANGFGRHWAAAHNAGIRASAKQIVALTDGSVFLPRNFVEQVAEFYASNTQASFLSFPERIFEDSGERTAGETEGKNLHQRGWEQVGPGVPADSDQDFKSHWRWQGGLVVAPGAALVHLQGFDEKWDLEWDTHLENLKDRAQIAGFDVWLAPRKLHLQRSSPGLWDGLSGSADELLEGQRAFDDSLRMMGRIRWAKQGIAAQNKIKL